MLCYAPLQVCCPRVHGPQRLPVGTPDDTPPHHLPCLAVHLLAACHFLSLQVRSNAWSWPGPWLAASLQSC